MVQNTTSSPSAGAGATGGAAVFNPYAATPASGDATGSHNSTQAGSQSRPLGREMVVAEQSRRPATATIVGAAIAGAIAGGAIPFMLAGRSSRAPGAPTSDREETVVTTSVIINRPAREIYDFWRNFTNLSQFMENIKSVEILTPTRSHWTIKAPAGTSVAFDSYVVDDVPGRSISWQSEEGAAVPNRGRVEFIETASGTGTNVSVVLSYEAPAGAAGRLLAKLFQREPSIQAEQDLARLKQLLEGSPAAAG